MTSSEGRGEIAPHTQIDYQLACLMLREINKA